MSDISRLEKWAEDQGWRVDVSQDGYRRFYDPQGNYIGQYPNTPGRPGRRWKALICGVKAAGLPWPPPSPSERRSLRRKERKEQVQEPEEREDD